MAEDRVGAIGYSEGVRPRLKRSAIYQSSRSVGEGLGEALDVESGLMVHAGDPQLHRVVLVGSGRGRYGGGELVERLGATNFS